MSAYIVFARFSLRIEKFLLWLIVGKKQKEHASRQAARIDTIFIRPSSTGFSFQFPPFRSTETELNDLIKWTRLPPLSIALLTSGLITRFCNRICWKESNYVPLFRGGLFVGFKELCLGPMRPFKWRFLVGFAHDLSRFFVLIYVFRSSRHLHESGDGCVCSLHIVSLLAYVYDWVP